MGQETQTNGIDLIDVTALDLNEIDQEKDPAIYNAVQAVLRSEQLPQTHQDHNSHSNSHD